MKWLSMIAVIVVMAACITLVFWAARRAERNHLTDRQPLPVPETLSVLLDPHGTIVEAHNQGEGRHLHGDPDHRPSTWQDLEPDYDIVKEHWVNDDEYGQVKLLQLRVKQP